MAEKGEKPMVSLFDPQALRRRNRTLVLHDSLATEFVHVAFSTDAKFVLTQSGAPDWTLTLWQLDKPKPLVSVKASPDAHRPVYRADFHPTDPSIVCACGNGILKFFRIIDNFFKVMPNTLLKREPQNYLCHAWLPEERVVVGTDTGDLLLFEHFELRTVLPTSPADGNSIDCIVPFSKGFVCGCEDGIVRVFEPSEDRTEFYRPTKTLPIHGHPARVLNMALSPSEENLALTLESHQLFMLNLSNVDLANADDNNFDLVTTPVHGPGARCLAASCAHRLGASVTAPPLAAQAPPARPPSLAWTSACASPSSPPAAWTARCACGRWRRARETWRS